MINFIKPLTSIENWEGNKLVVMPFYEGQPLLLKYLVYHNFALKPSQSYVHRPILWIDDSEGASLKRASQNFWPGVITQRWYELPADTSIDSVLSQNPVLNEGIHQVFLPLLTQPQKPSHQVLNEAYESIRSILLYCIDQVTNHRSEPILVVDQLWIYFDQPDYIELKKLLDHFLKRIQATKSEIWLISDGSHYQNEFESSRAFYQQINAHMEHILLLGNQNNKLGLDETTARELYGLTTVEVGAKASPSNPTLVYNNKLEWGLLQYDLPSIEAMVQN